MNCSEFNNTFPAHANKTEVSEKSTANQFVTVFGIFLLVSGSLGNLLTMLVIWAYKSMRSTSRFLFFLLACADEVTLFLAEVRYWTLAAFGWDLRDYNAFICRAHTFLTTTFVGSSVWILCHISLERMWLAWFPTKKHPFGRVRSVVIVIIVTVIFNVALNISYLFRAYSDGHCGDITVGYKKAVPLLGYILSYFLPFVIMLMATVLLLWKILRQKRQVGIRDASSSMSRSLKTTTIMLVAIVAAQLVLGTPGYVFSILIDFKLLEHFNKKDVNAVYVTLLSLMVMNNASNFYIYVLSARGFRQTFLKLFSRICSKWYWLEKSIIALS